jgi:hypothetical protein
MTEAAAPHPHRTLVLLEQPQATDAVLAAVAAILPDRQAPVHGLLLEDPNVLRLGALSEALEVTIGEARVRTPRGSELERQLRAAAREVRSVFERKAAELSLPASFEVRRGRGFAELARVASGAQLVVIGRARSAASRAWWDVELSQVLAGVSGDLAFVPAEPPGPDGQVGFISESETDDVARLARRIADRTGVGLLRLAAATLAGPRVLPRLMLGAHAGALNYLVVPAQAVPSSALRDLLSSCRSTIVLVRSRVGGPGARSGSPHLAAM